MVSDSVPAGGVDQFSGGTTAGSGIASPPPAPEASTALQQLAGDFWRWRAEQQPRSADDIPRIDRPWGWTPDWSAPTVEGYRHTLRGFEHRWQELDVSAESVSVQVDHRLVGSAVARVTWELDVLRSWQRDPGFYVDQSLGSVFDLLLEPAPFGPERAAEIVHRLGRVPGLLDQARANLAMTAVPEFVRLCADRLRDVENQLTESIDSLTPYVPAEHRQSLGSRSTSAVAALGRYRDWLDDGPGDTAAGTAVGVAAFRFFLSDVALLPYEPADLLAVGRQEWDRAVTFELLEGLRNRGRPELALPKDVAEQVTRQRLDERRVRDFYEGSDLLTQPASLRHYLTAPLPPYLEPLSWLGVTDDLTAESRLSEDAVSYMPQPRPDLPYFYLANARDPRLGIVHEGAHFQQLALSWAHPDPIRRRYYDSTPNEGLAFYNEELMLRSGLFDDSPPSREVLYSFMRLRALRVEVDVNLATGAMTVEEGAAQLRETVPMDAETAAQEAGFFAATPGQGLTYQVGKVQLLRLVADAARAAEDPFRLRDLHDYLWRNGNVPIALLRWEFLGRRDDLDLVDDLSRSVRTSPDTSGRA